MTLTISPFLVSMLAVVVMAYPLATAIWTWWIVRDRASVNENLIKSAQEAWESSGKTSEKMIGTTATMFAVMERSLKNLDRVNDRLSEVALTTHEGASVERMHNTAQRLLQIQGANLGIPPDNGRSVIEQPVEKPDPKITKMENM